MMKKFVLFSLSLLFLSACHPFIAFKPKGFPSYSKASMPLANEGIEILLDEYSIPHIKATTAKEAMYALGYMHARDRLFQLDLIRHAALGRLSELFGDKTIKLDRELRLLSYRLDEQVANLHNFDREFIENYAKGVNAGAKSIGRSAEHFLLGVSFEEFTLKDVVAIARLQSWELANDLHAELFRLRVAQSHNSLELKKEFLSAIDDYGSAILPNAPVKGAKQDWPWPKYLSGQADYKNQKSSKLFDINIGASNAWAISKNKTKEGVAILMNDPHLRHTWPGSFYLAALYTDEFFVAGASFVGMPAILIGSSEYVSWGDTASFQNAQDTVLLKMIDPDHYEVENKKYQLTKWPQKFCVNKKGKCLEENFYESIFGPVIDRKYNKNIAKDQKLAVMWTGFLVDKHNDLCITFLGLPKAKNVKEAVKAAKAMTIPGVNMAFADIYGDVGYSYAGLVPKRDKNQHPFLPLDGSLIGSKWDGVLSEEFEPSVINPKKGYVITANQNVFPYSNDFAHAFGLQGAAPYRAMRIKEDIDNILDKGELIDENQLASIQMDATSILAKDLASYFGEICKEYFLHKDQARKQFCDQILKFDGVYTINSTGALPFEVLLDEIISNKLKEIFAPNGKGNEARGLSGISFIIKDALSKEKKNIKTAIFNGEAKRDIQNSLESAFLNIKEKYGTQIWKWRWGRVHYLQRQSPLAKAPIIGGLFKDKKRPVAGCSVCPMAEVGIPVTVGASLRMKVKMSNPPQINIVTDAGNSGFLGDKHSLDQAKLWHEGKTIAIPTSWEEAKSKAKSRLVLK